MGCMRDPHNRLDAWGLAGHAYHMRQEEEARGPRSKMRDNWRPDYGIRNGAPRVNFTGSLRGSDKGNLRRSQTGRIRASVGEPELPVPPGEN